MGVSASTPSAQQVYDQYRLHQDGLHIRSISVSVIAAQEAQGAVAASQEVEEGGRSNNDGSEATTAAAAAAAAATASSLRMVQEDDGELTFDALAYEEGTSSPSPEAVATAVTWICDPAAARKTASTSLLRLSVSEHDEQLQFSFRTRLLPLDDDHASDTAATSTLAFACTESPVALERVLAERKRAGLQHHPALTSIHTRPDRATGQLDFVWTYPAPLGDSGKRHCAFLSYLPDSDTFHILAAFSFWLDVRPSLAKQARTATSAPLRSASPQPGTGLFPSHLYASPPTQYAVLPQHATPSTDYLSPRPMYPTSANIRRTSWQSSLQTPSASRANDGRAKRYSFQSDVSRSGSPGHGSDGHSAAGHASAPAWSQLQHAASYKRPAPQRSATSPVLSQDALSHAKVRQASMSSSVGQSQLAQPAAPGPHPPSSSPQLYHPTPLPILGPIEDIPEDGPLFKAHCKEMEERAYYLRRSLKQLIKSAEAVYSALRLLDDAEYSFDHSLHELSGSNPNAVAALNDAYWDSARRIQGFARKEGMLRLEELVIEPLKRIASMLKAADIKKKIYDAESKAFYDHVHRYLNVKKETSSSEGKIRITAADDKHKIKKDKFALARLEYYNALRELAVFKECATLATLAHYVHSMHDIAVASGRDLDGTTTALDDLDLRIDALSAEIEDKKTEIETKRRTLEMSFAMQRPDGIGAQQQFQASRPSLDASEHLSPPTGFGAPNRRMRVASNGSTEGLALSVSPDSNVGSSGPWLQPPSPLPTPAAGRESSSPTNDLSAQLRRKEGFLWANTRPISHQGNVDAVKHWHKSWVVLAGGQLCEYADDKLELAAQPINLRFATVREARTQDRRFAFEVITPSLRRIYQATSTEEAQSWLQTVANVIQSLLDGTSSVRHFVRPGTEDQGQAGELGLGIFAGNNRASASGSSTGDGMYASAIGRGGAHGGETSNNGPAEGMKAVLAKLNKPLQRRTSSGHRKRDSVSALVSNLAANARGKKDKDRDREKDSGQPLSTLLEASQSMASFFSDARSPNPSAHAKYASSSMDRPGQHAPVRSPEFGATEPVPYASPTTTEAELDQSIATAVDSAFGPVKQGKQTRESKDRNHRELLELLQLPDNRHCADCLARDPRWASWNIGIFICIRCSGLHRALGTHISKVRSVDLDDWNDEQLSRMRERGNEAARLLWEPPELPPEVRTDAAGLIRMKYVEKRWHKET